MRGVLSFHFPRNRYERKSANQAAGDECESEQAMRRLLRLFSKVRARSCSCSSFPNRTRCAGLRFGFGCRTESGGIYTVVMFHKKAPLWGAFLWKHFPNRIFGMRCSRVESSFHFIFDASFPLYNPAWKTLRGRPLGPAAPASAFPLRHMPALAEEEPSFCGSFTF